MRRVENLMLKMVGLTYQEGLPGKTPLLQNRERLLRKARSSIKIVDKRLPQEVFNSPTFLNTLKQAGRRDVEIELITGPKPDKKSLDSLASLPISIHQLDQPPKRSFTLVDGKHARLEAPLTPDQKQIMQLTSLNWKYAWELNTTFLELKEKARLVSL